MAHAKKSTRGHRPDLLRGAIAGLAAGLVASFVMDQFQNAVEAVSDSDQDDDPATVKAADKVTRATTGEALPETRKDMAGSLVHYALGSALGVAYGMIAEYRPEITKGIGSGYGLATFALLDEVAVPALGLSDPPQEAPAGTQAYGAVSHLVFGLAVEGTRRAVRAAI